MGERLNKGKAWKGSLTVEAALLQGLLLLVIFLSLALYWYCHNRIWFTAAACEAAMTGSMEAAWNREAAPGVLEEKLRQIRENQAFPCRELRLEESLGTSQVQVRCSGGNSSVLGGWKGSFKIQETARITRPAEYIRKLRALKRLVGTGG